MKKGFMFSIVSMCILLMVIGFTYGYYSTNNRISQKPKGDLKDLEIDANVSGNEETNSSIIIDKDTTIEYVNNYLECEAKVIIEGKPDDMMLNMDKKEFITYLERNNPKWKLTEFTNKKVIILINKEGKCENHDIIDGFLIKEDNGTIYLYGLNENAERISSTKLANIEFSVLPKEAQQDLSKGIEKDSEEEAYEYLQNLD